MKYKAILADPPWAYKAWSGDTIPCRNYGTADSHYQTMKTDSIADIPVADFADDDCALFCWITWPTLLEAVKVIDAWGFTYKTCAFCWVKSSRLSLYPEDIDTFMGLGYWTRANTEVCLLATKGKPRRVSAGVKQVIAAPLREHSRKPDAVYERIEELVEGPYLEMFARQSRPGWSAWGNETTKFDGKDSE